MKEHKVDMPKYPGEFADRGDSEYAYCLICDRKIQRSCQIALIQQVRSVRHVLNRTLKLRCV